MSLSKKIRTCVIGTGNGHSHAIAYKKHPMADIRWIVDINENRAAEVAREVGARYATRFEDVLDDIDAVSISLPHHLHAPFAIQAMEAGKHVMVEKPMANTESECQDMIQAAEKNNVKLVIALPLRYRPAMHRLKEGIENEEFGTVISLNGFVHSYLSPNPGSWFSKKDQLGGGVLFSHGCHDIDLMVWLLGMPRRVACFTTRNGTDWMEGEGTAQCILEFESGILGNLSVSWGTQYKRQPNRLQVHASEAMVSTNQLDNLRILDKDGERIISATTDVHQRILARGVSSDTITVRDLQVEDFLFSIHNDQRPFCDGYEGLKALRVIWEMYRFQEENPVAEVV